MKSSPASREHKRPLLLSALLAQMAVLLSGLALLLLFCAIASSTEDPAHITTPLSLAALYLSAMIGGIVATRLSGVGLLAGCLSGVGTALLVFLLALLPLPLSGIALPYSVILPLCTIPASAVGAFLGMRRDKSAERRRAHIRRARR